MLCAQQLMNIITHLGYCPVTMVTTVDNRIMNNNHTLNNGAQEHTSKTYKITIVSDYMKILK